MLKLYAGIVHIFRSSRRLEKSFYGCTKRDL